MRKLAKKILHILPFKKQIFSVIKFLFRPSEKIYRHLYFNGTFRVKVDAGHSFKIKHYGYQLENEVFWEGLTGHWEKESMKAWIRLCSQSSSIFDVGANTGIYSLVAQATNPSAKVYAFEPLETIYNKLTANADLNKYPIQSFKVALSDSDGQAAIHKVNADHTYEGTLNKIFENWLPDARSIKVDTITLKTFIEKNNIPHIDLIKIDVETHEPEVLIGFGEYLQKFKPAIMIELIIQPVVDRVKDLMKDSGYLYFNIDESKGIRLVQTLDISDSYNFLFCTPDQAKRFQLV